MEKKFRAWVKTYDGHEMINDYCFLEPIENHFHGTDLTNERPDITKVLAIMQFVSEYKGRNLYECDICKLSGIEAIEKDFFWTDENWCLTMQLVFDDEFKGFWFVDEKGELLNILRSANK